MPGFDAALGAAKGALASEHSERVGPVIDELVHGAVAVDEQRARVAAVDPGQGAAAVVPDREHGGQELIRATEVEGRLVDDLGGLLQRGVVAPGGAQRADGERGDGRCRVALAHRVAHGEPQPVVVVGVVEEVTADLIARKDATGDLGALDGGDAGWQQVLLDLGGGVDVPAPSGAMDDVGVAAAELQREGGLIGEAPGGRRSRRRTSPGRPPRGPVPTGR